MAVKLVVGPAEVRARYGLQDLSDVNANLESGLVGAHAFFEGELGTQFGLVADQQDVFYTDSSQIPSTDKHFRYRLRNAFVRAGSVAVKAATSMEALASASALAGGVAQVNLEKGLIYLPDSYDKQFVAVNYGSGLAKAPEGTPPPEWLKEAILSWMASVLVFTAHKDKPELGLKLSGEVQRAASNMVTRHKRETAMQFLPLF